tara:strand:+ start:314 stop:904 length:591 start_codon:yes stop_codon:yes gene_type:complete
MPRTSKKQVVSYRNGKPESTLKTTTVTGRKGNVKKTTSKYKSGKVTEKTKMKVKKYDPSNTVASPATFKAKGMDGTKTKEKGTYGRKKLSDDDRFMTKKEYGASAKFPEIKEKNEGKFTAWVEKNMGGMDTCKAASKIMKSKTKKYSPAVVKMANYANNFGCKNKKDDGASVPLKGKQKNLPDALKSKILASSGKK